jgi:hypothetical protein
VKERGQDFVTFKLKAEAPERVARGGARFSGVFERSAEPFRCTLGEWNLCWSRLGYFEEAEAATKGDAKSDLDGRD